MMCNVICDLNTKWKICTIWIESINQSMFITPATTHRIFQASKAKHRATVLTKESRQNITYLQKVSNAHHNRDKEKQ